MINRVIIVGTRIYVKKLQNVEFVRVRRRQKFEIKKDDLIIVFNEDDIFFNDNKKGFICLFSIENAKNNKFFLESLDTDENNKKKIPLLFSMFKLT